MPFITSTEYSRLQHKIENLEAENARLREALKPFVGHYEKWMDEHPDSAQTSTFARVTFKQIRAARAAMETKP